MTRKRTKPLTPQQQRAVELLLLGTTTTATATAIGVSRETVHRWLRENFCFIAAMNRARQELNDAATTRLFVAWSKATENVAVAVQKGDLKASLLLLRHFAGVLGAPPSIGSDDPETLAEEAAERAARAEQAAESAASLNRMLSDLSKGLASE